MVNWPEALSVSTMSPAGVIDMLSGAAAGAGAAPAAERGRGGRLGQGGAGERERRGGRHQQSVQSHRKGPRSVLSAHAPTPSTP